MDAGLERLLLPAEASQLLRVPETTLRQWRHRCVGPKCVHVGRGVRYAPSDLAAWLETREHERVVADRRAGAEGS